MSIDILHNSTVTVAPSEQFQQHAVVQDDALYRLAQEDRLSFWETQARQLKWFSLWHTVLDWKRPYAKWFVGGTLNAAYNCLDVHLHNVTKNKAALIWEGESGETKTITYFQLHKQVCQLANALQTTFSIKKGDRVTLYMPMIPELVVAVLACARVGAIHSVVFGGFSAVSLRDRIHDSQSRLVITADGGFRRGQIVPLKRIVDEALSDDSDKTSSVEHVVIVQHTGEAVSMTPTRDVMYRDTIQNQAEQHNAQAMDSEDPLFILYTSGTTGKPKGIVHSTGGYLTHAKYSTRVVFDLHDDDIYWCTADIGWITGHTYLVYGPLLNGATAFMFEGTPDYPHPGRFWELIQSHGISIFYTAPTAIRAFMKQGEKIPNAYNLSSLRLLGTVGEPINPEAWMWYYTVIGNKQCPIVDTWWQTETGGIMITTLPGKDKMKPGVAGKPLPGISATILETTGESLDSGGGLLSLTEPWPSMLRGVWGDPQRYEDTYWSTFNTYFAGDGATMDTDGYIKVLGRVDDVLNVAGHRIGTMEVESALVEHPDIAEAAVVGMHDEVKGQAIAAFVILNDGRTGSEDLEQTIRDFVGNQIGPIAKPKRVIFTPELPKTRSGKIMRRLLKNIALGQDTGDTTTLANPEIVESLKSAFERREVSSKT